MFENTFSFTQHNVIISKPILTNCLSQPLPKLIVHAYFMQHNAFITKLVLATCWSKSLPKIIAFHTTYRNQHPSRTRHQLVQIPPKIITLLFVNLLPNWTLLPILTLLPNFERFPQNIATGAASKQRTFTPTDTLSCSIWDFHFF